MIEYKVRRSETGGTAEPEDICNHMAKDGWRLVSTAAANGDGTKAFLHLFFEREIEARDRLEDTVATMDLEERRELMDVAVAQADGESTR